MTTIAFIISVLVGVSIYLILTVENLKEKNKEIEYKISNLKKKN